MKKLFVLIMFLMATITVNGYCGIFGGGNPDMYHIGSSSAVVVSSSEYTHAYAITASTTYVVNIDDMKFWADAIATVKFSIALSSNVTGGYDAVIADVRPLALATKNLFTAKCGVVCASTNTAVGTVFKLPANQGFEYFEEQGKMQIPKGYVLLIDAMSGSQADGAFYGQFRVWE